MTSRPGRGACQVCHLACTFCDAPLPARVRPDRVPLEPPGGAQPAQACTRRRIRDRLAASQGRPARHGPRGHAVNTSMYARRPHPCGRRSPRPAPDRPIRTRMRADAPARTRAAMCSARRLRRLFYIDPGICVRRGARLRVLAVITDPRMSHARRAASLRCDETDVRLERSVAEDPRQAFNVGIMRLAQTCSPWAFDDWLTRTPIASLSPAQTPSPMHPSAGARCARAFARLTHDPCRAAFCRPKTWRCERHREPAAGRPARHAR